jgi:NADH:ubiquinone oxidoreductase subunit K
MSVGLTPILVGSAALFAVGAFALVARRNVIITLLGAQFMLVAAAIAFVAFGRFGLAAEHETSAAAMAIFVGAISLAELGIGLSMALLIYRENRSFAVDADRF